MERRYRWIHVLLKGERPITDTARQECAEIDKYVSTFKANSLDAVSIPILEFSFTNSDHLLQIVETALEKMKLGLEDVGIVLTSPRVVEAISRSLGSKVCMLKQVNSQLVFVIGEKTGSDCLNKLGIGWNKKSISSGNSISLSEVIKLTISTWHRPVRLIYAKSSLADQTIENSLSENAVIDSVIAYETRGATSATNQIREELEVYLRSLSPELETSFSRPVSEQRDKLVLNFVFFSPSGVECFFTIKEQILTYLTGDFEMRYSCIGRTTEKFLKQFDASAHCIAEKPGAQALVDAILLKCPARDDGVGSKCACSRRLPGD